MTPKICVQNIQQKATIKIQHATFKKKRKIYKDVKDLNSLKTSLIYTEIYRNTTLPFQLPIQALTQPLHRQGNYFSLSWREEILHYCICSSCCRLLTKHKVNSKKLKKEREGDRISYFGLFYFLPDPLTSAWSEINRVFSRNAVERMKTRLQKRLFLLCQDYATHQPLRLRRSCAPESRLSDV